MAHLFYLLGVFFLLHEINISRYPKKYLDKLRAVGKKEENEEGYEDGKRMVGNFSDMSDKEKGIVRLAFLSLFYFVWLVIGVAFSGQWIVFTGLIAFGLMISFIRRRFYKNNTRKSISIIKFDAFVSSVTLAFLVINHFHHII